MELQRTAQSTTGAEQRTLRLGPREIVFTLRRSARRTLGMQIDRRGLTVTIPLRASLRETEAFMRERAAWIVEKLDEWAQRQPPPSVQISDGMQLPVFGEPCTVHWTAGANRTRWVEGYARRELHLHLRRHEDAPRVLLRGLQEYALPYFAGRLDEYVYLLQRTYPEIQRPPLYLSNARTRWGSCSKLSGIRLNWRLIHLPRPQIDYVVAHEVAHLVEMNHSPRFWRLVGELKPDYERDEAALKQAHRVIPVF
ncbi:M48 family metallopeptidase [Uliginosibacterium aquaticum]|uniref:M48 family metallopeptidase n=1 Tax=Uliginosibacterium aquaticum TaxID=2731212 RepID=A0ABX2IFH9_9RHOO|nr:SprT family zinc-dependent metalloprotease [Uliginosibacterium aquaticum]NSL53727.1 M48 family metallopeptidase [Uliginosibacterium aquaticum]